MSSYSMQGIARIVEVESTRKSCVRTTAGQLTFLVIWLFMTYNCHALSAPPWSTRWNPCLDCRRLRRIYTCGNGNRASSKWQIGNDNLRLGERANIVVLDKEGAHVWPFSSLHLARFEDVLPSCLALMFNGVTRHRWPAAAACSNSPGIRVLRRQDAER